MKFKLKNPILKSSHIKSLEKTLVYIYNNFIFSSNCTGGLILFCQRCQKSSMALIKKRKKSESLKVFRLKATILSRQFVNLVMFYCSLLSKTCLNVYRPTSSILSLPGITERCPPVSFGGPWWFLFKNDANEKKGGNSSKTGFNGFPKTETVSWGLALMNCGLKTVNS